MYWSELSLIHTGRFWCFTRITYMSIAFLYGKKFVGPITPTILALRDELYSSPYDQIDWSKARNSCAKVCHCPSLSLNHYYTHKYLIVQCHLYKLVTSGAWNMCNVRMTLFPLLRRHDVYPRTLRIYGFVRSVLKDGESTIILGLLQRI